MTNGFYGETLATIGEFTKLVDLIVPFLEDAGIQIDEIPLTTEDGDRFIGRIYFDNDRHPYFVPQQPTTKEWKPIDWSAVYAAMDVTN